MRDYIRLLGAVKEMLQSRHDALLKYQQSSKHLEQLQEKKEKSKNHSGKFLQDVQQV